MNGNAVRWFLDRHVEENRGQRMAFSDPWRSLTYAELQEASARAAGALAGVGITPERRVLLWLLDTVDFPTVFWGSMRLGAVPVPVNTLLATAQLADLLRDSAAEALVVSAPLLPAALEAAKEARRLRAVFSVALDGTPQTGLPAGVHDLATCMAAADLIRDAEHASSDQVAFWLYSSGSTGTPKGVKHVHASLRATAETYGAQVLGIREDDVCFSAAKLFFAYGLGNAITFPMSVGARSVLLPDRPTPKTVLEMMARHRPTIFFGVPTLYASLLAAGVGKGAGSDRLRRCISAGEALPEALGRRWAEEVGLDILDGIGSTEMLHIFLSNRVDRLRYGTSGVLVPGYEARIVDADCNPVLDGERGELLIKGPSAAEGYWNRRERSRRTFLGEWTATGDIYIRDAEGFYIYQGRNDDMFKVSGIWVSPFEVEAALVSHPDVLEAAVVARRDADGLIKPMAFVVPRDPSRPPDAAALQAHVKAIAGPWKYPRWIEVVAELPKTPTGKIQRFRLRERVAAEVAT